MNKLELGRQAMFHRDNHLMYFKLPVTLKMGVAEYQPAELTTRSCDGSSDTIMQQGGVYSSFQVSWKNLGSSTCANRSSLRFLTTWEQGYGETN